MDVHTLRTPDVRTLRDIHASTTLTRPASHLPERQLVEEPPQENLEVISINTTQLIVFKVLFVPPPIDRRQPDLSGILLQARAPFGPLRCAQLHPVVLDEESARASRDEGENRYPRSARKTA